VAFNDLTVEQRGIIAEYVKQQRAMVGGFARWLNQIEAADNMYDGQVVAAWASLADSDLIPDGSGLAGVSLLSKAEVASIAGAFQAILNTYQTEALRRLYVRMAGMTNTI
jgi:hypothetical protein